MPRILAFSHGMLYKRAMETPVIMIIEDDEGIREAYSSVLQDEGYVVFGFGNARDALAVLEEEKPPSLILLDWMMPEMTGEQFISSEIGGNVAKKTPVVVISAVAGLMTKLPGVRESLRKPVDLERLLRTVSRYCDRQPA